MESNWGWPAIGIDLGDRFSRVAIWKHGRAEIIVNDQGNRKTPSYVAFTDDQLLIGDAAKNQSTQNPANTIFDANKLIGRTFSEVTAQYDVKSWPFKVIAGAKNDKPKIVVSYKGEEKQFSAEEICSMVISKMKETVEAYLGVKVKYAVITVPAYFNGSQRQATKDAGVMAGLKSVHTINEPTAVAVAYGLNKQRVSCSGTNVLVFNLGGGTLDVSLLNINEDIVELKAVCWDPQLGGDAFDKIMASNFIQVLNPLYGHYISENPEHVRRLVASCERAKRRISTCSETTIGLYCDYLGCYMSSTVTRARFEWLNEYLFKDCMRLVEKCFWSAKLESFDIDHVILVGGSTRIPKVQKMLKQLFNGKELCNSMNPEEVVAYGAAMHAAMLNDVDVYPVFPVNELHIVQESCTSLILNDIDSVLENLSTVSKKNSMSISYSKAQFLKLLEEIRRKPNDLHLTGKMSQLLQDFHPSLPMHSLTVIKSLEDDLLASQHRFMEWTKKEVDYAPLKLKEAGTVESNLVRMKTQILQKTSSREQLRSKIAETDEDIARLMNYKSQQEKDLRLADQDLGKLARSISPQVDLARQKSARLAHLQEASNFKAKAWISLQAALDSFANYLKNL